MKQMIKLNESQLNRVIKESIAKVLNESMTNEGLGDRFQGAVKGWQQGGNQTSMNDMDANSLWSYRQSAMQVLKNGNPQECMQWMQNFVKGTANDQSHQQQTYGQGNYHI